MAKERPGRDISWYLMRGAAVASVCVGSLTALDHTFGPQYMRDWFDIDIVPGHVEAPRAEDIPLRYPIDLNLKVEHVPDYSKLPYDEWTLPEVSADPKINPDVLAQWKSYDTWTIERWLANISKSSLITVVPVSVLALLKVPGADKAALGISSALAAAGLGYSVDEWIRSLDHATIANTLQWGGATSGALGFGINRAKAVRAAFTKR